MYAIRFALQSFLPFIKGHKVRWYTDSQNCVRIVECGSTQSELHDLALEISYICSTNGILLNTVWIPRDLNTQADALSKLCDYEDWGVTEEFFEFLDKLWGPHSVDRFANHYNAKVKRFNSLTWVPGTETVDAFSEHWQGENNWLVPPVRLIPSVINHIHICKAQCTLIAPFWPSQAYYPMIFSGNSIFRSGIADVLVFNKNQDIFKQYLNQSTIFGSSHFTSKVLAIRFEY